MSEVVTTSRDRLEILADDLVDEWPKRWTREGES
jgi:hypothetical protein